MGILLVVYIPAGKKIAILKHGEVCQAFFNASFCLFIAALSKDNALKSPPDLTTLVHLQGKRGQSHTYTRNCTWHIESTTWLPSRRAVWRHSPRARLLKSSVKPSEQLTMRPRSQQKSKRSLIVRLDSPIRFFFYSSLMITIVPFSSQFNNRCWHWFFFDVIDIWWVL